MVVNLYSMLTIQLFILVAKKKELNKVATWSKDTNLVFNPNKTEVMIISSCQMPHYHHRNSADKVKILNENNEKVEKVK